MALRLNASNETLTRSSPPALTSFTVCGWAYIVTDRGNGLTQPIVSFTPTAAAYLVWEIDSSANTMQIGSYDGGATANNANFGSRPAVATWFFFYLRCSGTGANLLQGGWALREDAAFTTATTTLTTTTRTGLALNDTGFTEHSDIRLAGVKVWDATLTDAELLNERATLRPSRFTNLHLWTPLIAAVAADNITDLSGNGRNWTAGGSQTVEDGPPVGWGAPPRWIGPAGYTPVNYDVDWSVSAAGFVTFAALGAVLGVGATSAGAGVQNQGVGTFIAAGAVAGSGALSGGALRDTAGEGTLPGGVDHAAAALRATEGDAPLDASGTSTGDATRQALADGATGAAGGLTGTGQHDATPTGSLALSAALAGTSTGDLTGAADLGTAGGLSFVGSMAALGIGDLGAGADIDGSAGGANVVYVELAAAALSGDAMASGLSDGHFTAGAGLSGAGEATIAASGPLASSGAMAGSGSTAAIEAGSLAAAAAEASTASSDLSAAAPLETAATQGFSLSAAVSAAITFATSAAMVALQSFAAIRRRMTLVFMRTLRR
jgi:hypothetical protein